MSRRPQSEVQFVTIFNDQSAATLDGIPMRFEIDSWVTLKATPIDKWNKDARSHGEDSLVGAWKAQIK